MRRNKDTIIEDTCHTAGLNLATLKEPIIHSQTITADIRKGRPLYLSHTKTKYKEPNVSSRLIDMLTRLLIEMAVSILDML